jgi:hypothetical protein
MVAPEVHTRVVIGDLIADFIASLLTVALQLLSVLNASRHCRSRHALRPLHR